MPYSKHIETNLGGAVAAAVQSHAIEMPHVIAALGDLAAFAELDSVGVGEIFMQRSGAHKFHGCGWAEIHFASSSSPEAFRFVQFLLLDFSGHLDGGKPALDYAGLRGSYGAEPSKDAPGHHPDPVIIYTD